MLKKERYEVDKRIGCIAVIDTKKYHNSCLSPDLDGVVAWWEGNLANGQWGVPVWQETKAGELCELLNSLDPRS